MGKSAIVILIIFLLALAGYAAYSAYPMITPGIQRVISWLPKPQPGTSSASATLAAPSPTPPVSFADSLTVTDYLQANLAIKSHNGEVYCAYKVLGSPTARPEKLYLLVLCQEYYQQQNIKLPGSGLVVPAALTLKWEDDSFNITEHFTPGLGSDYAPGVKSIFPADIAQNLLSDSYSPDVKLLQQKVDSAVY